MAPPKLPDTSESGERCQHNTVKGTGCTPCLEETSREVFSDKHQHCTMDSRCAGGPNPCYGAQPA
jgi:hypothetical protein